MFNLALIHEAIAARTPDREAIVFRDRRFSWREITDRTRRLADLMRGHGLGCHTERSNLENWESGQDHVGLYLRNGNPVFIHGSVPSAPGDFVFVDARNWQSKLAAIALAFSRFPGLFFVLARFARPGGIATVLA